MHDAGYREHGGERGREDAGDAGAELVRRTIALRKKLLALSLLAGFLGCFGSAAIYYELAAVQYAKGAAGAFWVGGVIVFGATYATTRGVMRATQRVWVRELARTARVSEERLEEALTMID
jgi:hypothetical protein